jgi:hypothetical protein
MHGRRPASAQRWTESAHRSRESSMGHVHLIELNVAVEVVNVAGWEALAQIVHEVTERYPESRLRAQT